MTKGFLIAVCIIIGIVLVLFPLIISYIDQKNKKILNFFSNVLEKAIENINSGKKTRIGNS